MPYTICTSDKTDFILISLHSNFDKSIAQEFNRKATTLARDRNLYKFLVDIRGCRSLSTLGDKYRYVQEKKLGETHWQSALLVDQIDLSIEFLESSMVEAGYNYKAFTCEKEARNWLMNENPRRPKMFELKQTCLV